MTEEQFWCSACKTSIGGHNQYLHDGMCDDCFFGKYFPEEAQIIETDPGKMQSHCRSGPIKKENRPFREFLWAIDFDQERIAGIVREIESKIICPHDGGCCRFLKPALRRADLDTFFANAEMCPIVFNTLENAKAEFLEDIYAFENPDV